MTWKRGRLCRCGQAPGPKLLLLCTRADEGNLLRSTLAQSSRRAERSRQAHELLVCHAYQQRAAGYARDKRPAAASAATDLLPAPLMSRFLPRVVARLM